MGITQSHKIGLWDEDYPFINTLSGHLLTIHAYNYYKCLTIIYSILHAARHIWTLISIVWNLNYFIRLSLLNVDLQSETHGKFVQFALYFWLNCLVCLWNGFGKHYHTSFLTLTLWKKKQKWFSHHKSMEENNKNNAIENINCNKSQFHNWTSLARQKSRELIQIRISRGNDKITRETQLHKWRITRDHL